MMMINPFAFLLGCCIEAYEQKKVYEKEHPSKPKQKKKPRTEAQRLNMQLVIAAAVIIFLLGLITIYEGGM